MFSRYESVTIGLVLVFLIVFIGVVTYGTFSEAKAKDKQALPSKTYETTGGNLIDVVKIPDVGICVIAAQDVECNWLHNFAR